MSKVRCDFNPKNSERRHQIFYWIDRIRQAVHLVRTLLERDIQLQMLRASEDFQLGMVARAVHVEALTEQGPACGWRSVQADNDVLNPQPRVVRGSSGDQVRSDHPVIKLKVQTGCQLRSN